MHGLEVRRPRVGIAPGHLQREVSKHLLQMKHGAAAQEMRGVTEGVERLRTNEMPCHRV